MTINIGKRKVFLP